MDIHIDNISGSMLESDLKELFAGFGEISSVKIIKDHYTNTSKGFAFITMPNENEALEAISKLNNYKVGHRVLSVSRAKARTTYRLI
ncbi:RNA-binding protein [Rhodocytophaga rosea]|uniref:RNA-binding protein n=1 Tax=Rhodocytophaga rosea TaxID=2704465 RepID=A0A6C0GT40_9BACT|nr:RNA-binding protein [Rhodocytophaga rosea]QHT71325.1 RNA-binding protein [Rhodocytophaga rosea]